MSKKMAKELKANILFVDDEEEFLNVFSERLKGRGLKIDTATSGEEAVKRAKDKDFDAIVLDLVMPGLGGIETLRRLKSENPDLQIIILTGHATVEKGIEVMKEGAIDLLEKPVDINKLMEKVGEARQRKILLVEKKAEDKVKDILQKKGW